jgi:hypothetical protein
LLREISTLTMFAPAGAEYSGVAPNVVPASVDSNSDGVPISMVSGSTVAAMARTRSPLLRSTKKSLATRLDSAPPARCHEHDPLSDSDSPSLGDSP